MCDLPAGLEGDTDVQFLLLGGELVKVRSTSWKKMRFFKLQEDCKTIWHESHKKFKRNQTCECGHLLAGLFASRPRCIRYVSRTCLFLASFFFFFKLGHSFGLMILVVFLSHLRGHDHTLQIPTIYDGEMKTAESDNEPLENKRVNPAFARVCI